MDFFDAKKQILEMAEKVNDNTLTQEDLVKFILGFRHELFHAETLEQGIKTYAIVSCSCANEQNSCVECGPGFTTGFQVLEDNQVVSFKIKKGQHDCG